MRLVQAIFGRSGLLLAMVGLLLVTQACDRQAASSAKRPTLADSELPSEAELLATIDEVLEFTERQRVLQSDVNAAWQVTHGILGYGRGFEMLHEEEMVSAVDYLLAGGQLLGWTMQRGEKGLKAVLEQGSKTGQGHEDQWLAVLVQAEVAPEEKIMVGEDEYTLQDLINQAKWDMYEGKECSWTLIGLTSYLPLDHKWTARDGQEWDFERIIAMEAAQDIHMSACGGTHRLIGMTMALARYRKAYPGRELTGGWLEADKRIREAIAMAKQHQQPSGAFSVNFFERPGDSPDYSVHMGTSGHTLEFLTLALSDEQLTEPWVVKATAYLCELFKKTQNLDLECGALYHAVHALQLYRERRLAVQDAPSSNGPPARDEKVPTTTAAAP